MATAVINISYKSLLVTSLFVVMLFSSLFVCVPVGGYIGVSLENAVHVKNEEELRTTINNISYGKTATIALDNDITLTETLRISGEKNVTLTSNRPTGFYKLVGPEHKDTIRIEEGVVLRIDGIIVTHTKGASGRGITVTASNPTLSITITSSYLYMYSGEISGNTADSLPDTIHGGGVQVGTFCFFELHGGKISGNKATRLGGGVDNGGNFKMFGGEISGNTAANGGGVSSVSLGSFQMFGGRIFGNKADFGGGVFMISGGFSAQGGVISGNTARNVGNNVCIYRGDDVYIDGETFNGDSETPVGDSGSSNGNNGSSDGNNGGSGSDGGGSSDGSNNEVSVGDGGGLFFGVFGLRDVVFIGVGVAVVVVGVVVAVLFFTYKKELEFVKGKREVKTQ